MKKTYQELLDSSDEELYEWEIAYRDALTAIKQEYELIILSIGT